MTKRPLQFRQCNGGQPSVQAKSAAGRPSGGPMVRILLPPAASHRRTGLGALPDGRRSDGRQAPPQTRKGLEAPPPHIRQFTPIRPRTACRAPAYAPWSIAKARNGVPRPRNRAGGVAALAQQSGLLPHDREDRPRLPPVALYHTFELGAPIRRHAQTIDDEVFDPVHVVVPGQAPIDSDRPGC